jgi:ribosomal protein S27E
MLFSQSMDEPLEAMCPDCPATVIFTNQPGSTTCQTCGAQLYLTASGQLGMFARDGWRPARLGRERKKR